MDDQTQLSVFDIFSTIEIIPLETTTESILNDPIDKILQHNNKFYLLDEKQYSILIFDSQGKYVEKINKLGGGPGEYKELCDFNFNRFTGNLEIMSAFGGKINIYEPDDFSFIKTIQLPDGEPVANYFANIDSESYVFFANNREPYKIFLYSTQKQDIINEFYEIPNYIMNETIFHHVSSPFYVFDDTVRFIQAFNGDVFNISQSSFSTKSQWDFNKANFNLSNIPANQDMNFYFQYAKKLNNEYAFNFLYNGENSKYYVTRFRYKNKYLSIIYDKANKKTLLFNNFKERFQCMPFMMDEVYLYTYMPIEYINKVINRDVLDNANMQKLESVQDTDNPVIVKFKFK